MTRKKLLFAVAGAGAGNIMRAAAIIEELGQDRFEIAFIAQGRSRELAPRPFRTYSLHDVGYGKGDFTAWNILRQNVSFPVRFFRNRRLCARVLDEVRPDLLVVDSDFYCFSSARKRGIPIVSINSSPATVALFRTMRRPSAGMRFSYHCIEKADRWLQRRYANRIICPVIEPVQTGIAKVHQVPPIVRRQFLEKAVSHNAAPCRYDVAVMLGGSGIGVSEIDLRDLTGSIVVLGDALEGRYPRSAERIPFSSQPSSYLSQSRVVVVQAGLNSVSEVIALRKPAVFLPIPNHAEQFVNAHCAQQLGIGLVSRGAQAGAAVRSLFERYEEVINACRGLSLTCDGAAKAARLIDEMAGG